MGFEVYHFTWSNGRVTDVNVQLRLDRAFSPEDLLLNFSYYKILHGGRFGSDHSSLIIHMDNSWVTSSYRQKIFRFEKIWTRELQCGECIRSAWQEGDLLSTNLSRVQNGLYSANFMGVRDFKKRIQNLERSLEITQSLPPTPHDLSVQKQLCSYINEPLETKIHIFFHKKASQRKLKNNIWGLKDRDGEWKFSSDELQNIMIDFFSDLFKTGDLFAIDSCCDLIKRKITPALSEGILRPSTRYVILNALHGISPIKTLVLMFFSAIFLSEILGCCG